MKRIRIIELLANIRANLMAFFSIAMFVCLGIGLFVGIGWGADALQKAGREALAKGNTHDVELQFPYGVTKADLKEIKEIEGVTGVEAGYSSFAMMKDGNTSHALKLESMAERINQPTFVVGALPQKAGEAALLRFWADSEGVKVGDRIVLKHDGEDEADADGMRYLTTDVLRVTALVDNPEYLGRSSLSLGISNVGTGSIDCVAYVTKDTFDAEAYSEGATNVYMRCSSLDGLNTFTTEYREAIVPIVAALEDLGAERAPAQYQKVHDEAQSKLTDVEGQIADAQKQIEEGKQQIEEGEQKLEEGRLQIEDGEKQLVEGLESASNEQQEAQQQLNDAYRQLVEGQAKYDAGLQTYNTAMDALGQTNEQFNAVRGEYDLLVSGMDVAQDVINNLTAWLSELDGAVDAYVADPIEENWARVEAAYGDVYGGVQDLSNKMGEVRNSGNTVSSALGVPLSTDGYDGLGIPASVDPQMIDSVRSDVRRLLDDARTTLDRVRNASVSVNGTTIALMDLPGGIQGLYETLAETEATLESSRAQLEAGWAEYNDGKARYDSGIAEGKATLDEKSRELEEGKSTLEEKSKELEEGKATLDEKSKELEAGKEKLESAKTEFAKLEEYEWVVTPRQDSGGTATLIMVSTMMNNVKWAMASLFVLVGLFVCYSAISRLVHEQIVQIGTKKALGFREGEIATQYLAFSALAVLIGVLASVLVGLYVVQLIMNPTAANQFNIEPYPPYFGLGNVLVMACVDMALILGSTWLAIHGLLKRNAIDLLSGESTANVKERFYEHTRLWSRMSLFSQTVVNNCVNDTRRVVATLVGVVGCTALIVTAVTLLGNVALSLIRHYEEVYEFNSVACFDDEGDGQAKAAAMVLYDEGVYSSPAFMRKLQARKEGGSRSLVRLVVPTNERVFKNVYHVISSSGGEADLEKDGVWVSAAYGEHMGVGAGDQVTLTENTGKTHDFTVAGVFDYYLLRQEFVMSKETYAEAFGAAPEANMLLVDSKEASFGHLRDVLTNVEGYETLVDDYSEASYFFGQIVSLLNIVVVVYLGLSAAMALMVLLNLDVMFVEEKKRELIVLMINGFSARQAKAYIYRDSIVLTIIGVLLGILLGAIVGGYTVFALEPDEGFFIKSFYPPAALVGCVGAVVFAGAALLWSLRRIPRFDLTDINRF